MKTTNLYPMKNILRRIGALLQNTRISLAGVITIMISYGFAGFIYGIHYEKSKEHKMPIVRTVNMPANARIFVSDTLISITFK